MKKIGLVLLTFVFAFACVATVFADKGMSGKFEAKAGEEIYVCACGVGCNCGTLSKKEGTCGCGQKLVKTSVTKVDKNMVYYAVDGKELSAPQMGKYTCACGKGCNCGTVSQTPGKCGCGGDLVEVK